MCKQLKEKLLQALMDNMGSVIDTLAEHSKSIKELEQRISQLSAKDSGAGWNKNIEFTIESAGPGSRYRYDAANGEYCKFLDSEHPGTYNYCHFERALQQREDGHVLRFFGTWAE